jgi:hypothetical protein
MAAMERAAEQARASLERRTTVCRKFISGYSALHDALAGDAALDENLRAAIADINRYIRVKFERLLAGKEDDLSTRLARSAHAPGIVHDTLSVSQAPQEPRQKLPNAAPQPQPKQAKRTYAGVVGRPTAAGPHQQSTSIPRTPTPKPPPATLPPKPPLKVERIFIRLSEAAEIRHASPHAVAAKLDAALPQGVRVGRVYPVPSGFAVEPAKGVKFIDFKEHADRMATALYAVRAETSEEWVKVYIPRLDRHLADLSPDGKLVHREITEEDLTAELARAFGARPLQVRWMGPRPGFPGNLGAATASFPHGTSIRFGNHLLFHQECRVQARTRKPRPAQCIRCWGHHPAARCIAASAKCGICAATEHRTDQHASSPHAARTQCANCHGPHRADHWQCPLRPKPDRQGQLRYPTRQEIKEARMANNTAPQTESTPGAPSPRTLGAGSQPAPSQSTA